MPGQSFTPLRPSLKIVQTGSGDRARLQFYDEDTHFLAEANIRPYLGDPRPFTLQVIREGKPWIATNKAARLAQWYLKLWHSPSTPVPQLKQNEWTDDKPRTDGTGDTERGYITPPARSIFYGEPPQAIQGFDALRAFARHRAAHRPLFHEPLSFSGSGYHSKDINAGTPYEWTTDKRTPEGWNAVDWAHLDDSETVAAAAFGDPVALIAFYYTLHLAQLSSPTQKTSWMTQPRSVGWLLEQLVWAHYLIDAPDELWGMNWGSLIKSRLEALQDNFFDIQSRKQQIAPGHALKTIESFQPFHWGIMYWGLANVLASKILKDDPEAMEMLKGFLEVNEMYLETHGVLVNGMMSRAVSFHLYEEEEATNLLQIERAALSATELRKKDPETYEVNGMYGIREKPRMSDTELMAPARLAIFGPTDPWYIEWASNNGPDMPKPKYLGPCESNLLTTLSPWRQLR